MLNRLQHSVKFKQRISAHQFAHQKKSGSGDLAICSLKFLMNLACSSYSSAGFFAFQPMHSTTAQPCRTAQLRMRLLANCIPGTVKCTFPDLNNSVPVCRQHSSQRSNSGIDGTNPSLTSTKCSICHSACSSFSILRLLRQAGTKATRSNRAGRKPIPGFVPQ